MSRTPRQGPSPIKLMVEYKARSPVWTNPVCPPCHLVDLTLLPLAGDLVSDLVAWQRHFDAHFSVERWPNWDSREAAEWHAAEGPRLYERLRLALPDTEVTLHMWVPGYEA